MTRTDALVQLAGAWAASGTCAHTQQRNAGQVAAEAARQTLDALAAGGDLEFDLTRTEELEQMPERVMAALERLGLVTEQPGTRGGGNGSH